MTMNDIRTAIRYSFRASYQVLLPQSLIVHHALWFIGMLLVQEPLCLCLRLPLSCLYEGKYIDWKSLLYRLVTPDYYNMPCLSNLMLYISVLN